jgi:hypothetical protein
MIIRFAHSCDPNKNAGKGSESRWRGSGEQVKDSLNIFLGLGSGAESAMTWRRGEQDLQQPLPYPTAIVRQKGRYRT